ncbi:ribonuclease Z [Candidatus Magnetobacterium bavaricum]|uniref:Ribonuclease Z n=1 Tax=Candidatus Magnetobacterium bavaricum TaxID=29290 RepID=A0A0F3GMU7_9BACT|nr:ribonuclease Z [Candidatus Magnetobacterium bavaricum]
MKTTFFCRVLNDPFNDPILFVRFRRQSNAFAFDLGDISALSAREVQKIVNVFVTHMHIDHFIGFDPLIRCLLGRETPVNIYGPDGIIEAVQSKLKGFTWNLIKQYPLKVEVCELTDSEALRASFYAQEGFCRIDRPTLPRSPEILSYDGISVEACGFDHGIPVLGYSLKEDFHINVNKALLDERGFTVGPWLNTLKSAIRSGNNAQEFVLNDRVYTLEELRSLVLIARGQKVCYITDISPTQDNIDKAIALAGDADVLYIEAFFLEADTERSLRRNHLTTTLAGYIAKQAGVKVVEVVHVSPKYISAYSEVISEVLAAFGGEEGGFKHS